MAEQEQEAKDFDSRADSFLNEVETETPAESSAETNQEGEESQAKASGAEPVKTEQVKAVENDSSLSVEDKIAKIKEILGDDEKALDAYIKQKGYHNDPAWQKQREMIEKLKKEGALSQEDKEALSEFKKFRSSAEYIQSSMKQQGYTQDAIDRKLIEAGFDVKVKPQDDVNLVVERLGISFDGMSPEDKANMVSNISDISKVFNVLFEDRFGKALPKTLAPIQQHIESTAKEKNATKLSGLMKDITKKEAILDFDKDVKPELDKFLDDNPKALQEEVFDYFKEVSRRLTIERLKTGNNQAERDKKKSNLRQNIPFSTTGKSVIKKTGNFDKDADAFLESIEA